MADEGQEPSVPASVGQRRWSNDQAVDFEVAHDTIGRFIAECTGRYWVERRKPDPDPAVMERWDEEARVASQARHTRGRG